MCVRHRQRLGACARALARCGAAATAWSGGRVGAQPLRGRLTHGSPLSDPGVALEGHIGRGTWQLLGARGRSCPGERDGAASRCMCPWCRPPPHPTPNPHPPTHIIPKSTPPPPTHPRPTPQPPTPNLRAIQRCERARLAASVAGSVWYGGSSSRGMMMSAPSFFCASTELSGVSSIRVPSLRRGW